jgi:hypothetical protein
MKKIAVVFCVVFSFAAIAVAQTARKTVTDLDLEKYRAQRMAAEREYRNTYAQRGMLSPEELKAASEARIQQTLDLAERLKAQQLEERRLALEANAQQIQIEELRSRRAEPVYFPNDYFILGAGIIDNGFGGRFRGRGFPRVFGRGVYAAGGNVWAAPLGSTPTIRRPSFRIATSHGRRH